MPGKRLTAEERAKIEMGFAAGLEAPQIAALIDRDRSTVWRELNRNNSYRGAKLSAPGARHPAGRHRGGSGRLGGVYRWVYSAAVAQRRAQVRARRPHRCKLRSSYEWACPPLWRTVLEKLRLQWSPQQISAWLHREFPESPEMWVSHETIYQAIYIQPRGALRAELSAQLALRTGRTKRRSQSRGAAASRRPWAAELNISARPPEAADRAVPGHWEGDLVIGAGGASAIITLVERSSRFVVLGALPRSRASEAVIEVLTQRMGQVPTELARSLTWDLGTEMATHAEFTLATGVPVYFCDPHSPWQRGSNENTVSMGVPRLGCSDKLVLTAPGDSREYWPPLGCALRLTCPWGCRHRLGPPVLA